MAKVLNKKKSPVGINFPSGEGSKAVKITLEPGENQVDDAMWADAKKHKMVMAALGPSGHLEEVSAAPAKEAAKEEDKE